MTSADNPASWWKILLYPSRRLGAGEGLMHKQQRHPGWTYPGLPVSRELAIWNRQRARTKSVATGALTKVKRSSPSGEG
jgi:hypothetical protein